MSTIKTTTLSNVAGTASVPVNTVINGSAKAWVNFNGTGTVAIRAAFNVSSITDNGTGDYTVNFTNAMPDANYSVIASGSNTGTYTGVSAQINSTSSGNAASAPTTTTTRITFSQPNVGYVDTTYVSVAIFGN